MSYDSMKKAVAEVSGEAMFYRDDVDQVIIVVGGVALQEEMLTVHLSEYGNVATHWGVDPRKHGLSGSASHSRLYTASEVRGVLYGLAGAGRLELSGELEEDPLADILRREVGE